MSPMYVNNEGVQFYCQVTDDEVVFLSKLSAFVLFQAAASFVRFLAQHWPSFTEA